jgi:S1-C subfamily serine protease
LVNQVQPDSPAEKGGIRHGDIIIKVDEVVIESAPQLRLVVSQMRPGREVQVQIIRQGETLTLPVVLGSLSGSLASVEPEQGILEGVRLEVLNSRMRRGFSVPDDIDGVVISEVSIESPYADLMARAMIILEVNGEAVTTPEAVEANLHEGVNRLYIWSAGTKRFLVIRIQE